MSGHDFQLKVYSTLLECMASYFNCDVSEVKSQQGYWEWVKPDGTKCRHTVQVVIDLVIEKNKVWAWIEDKHIIHIWHDKEADQQEIISTLAHEIGHSYRPFHRDRHKEEIKAEKFADVAAQAFYLMNNL